MLTARERRRFTPEEYLLLEERAELKSEYCDGEIYQMTGGSLRHNTIALNVVGELRRALKGRNCQVFSSDVRLYVKRSRLFTYPDVLVVCGAPKLMAGRTDTLTAARLILEVLSPSTESYDRGEKLRLYQGLPSLQEYILVPQDSRDIESHARQGPKKWLWSAAPCQDGQLPLTSLAVSLSVEAIYAGVKLGSLPEGPA